MLYQIYRSYCIEFYSNESKEFSIDKLKNKKYSILLEYSLKLVIMDQCLFFIIVLSCLFIIYVGQFIFLEEWIGGTKL